MGFLHPNHLNIPAGPPSKIKCPARPQVAFRDVLGVSIRIGQNQGQINGPEKNLDTGRGPRSWSWSGRGQVVLMLWLTGVSHVKLHVFTGIYAENHSFF